MSKEFCVEAVKFDNDAENVTEGYVCLSRPTPEQMEAFKHGPTIFALYFV